MDRSESALEEIGQELRLKILNSTAAEAGIQQSEAVPRVWGVVMDWPVSEAIATVVGLADGHASLYTTASFGIIGGSGHESVRTAAQRFVQAAASHLDRSAPVDEFPYPNTGELCFYLLTFDGVRRLSANGQQVEGGTDELSALFGDGQALLTELRLTQEDGGAGAGAGGEREESGLSSYLNCLLTGMAEGIGSRVEVIARQSVPNLEQLSVEIDDLHAWISAQEFDYSGLAADELIRLVRTSERIRGLPFIRHKGEMRTMHAQPDGTARARVFDIVIAPRNKSMTITLARDDDPRVIGLQDAADQQARK